MEEEGEKSPVPALSVLQRLNHLDHLLLVLEERQSLSARYPSGLVAEKIRAEEQDHCMTISSALEEAHHRGTLMDRVAMLKDRVLQLSLEIEVGIISKSSYSTVPTTGNVNQHISELAVTTTESADSREHGKRAVQMKKHVLRRLKQQEATEARGGQCRGEVNGFVWWSRLGC
ncbi:hypothetical protein NL676_006527 [Syzygium grande]|nr:hypothetical protein NL676_006527 [Syzygium grande]